MSRTARLFLLMDALRAKRRPVTAAALGVQLKVSERTIYRDIATLVELGASIDGEAGSGYVLRTGFFMPPLMFGADELEALVLGARWVRRQGDASLAAAASNALAKIAAAAPKDLRDAMADTSLWVPIGGADAAVAGDVFVQPAREAIRHEHKLCIGYRDEAGATSERTVWPIALAFFEGKRLLAAWCELRGDFRHFRIDRIGAATSLGERYPTGRRQLLKTWRLQHGIAEDS
jgi:predicted DNA-binding transcriptional regulator YafY